MLSPRPFPRAEPYGWAQPGPSAAEADRLRSLSVPQKAIERMLLAPARAIARDLLALLPQAPTSEACLAVTRCPVPRMRAHADYIRNLRR